MFEFEKHISMKHHFAGLQTHFFHIVTESPWPWCGACAALCMTVGGVMHMHHFDAYNYIGFNLPISLLQFGFLILFLTAYVWWRDVIREATYLGYHTSKVVYGLKIGMILFIISEVMFFFSFFWAFFHASLAPSMVLGSVWPPMGINVLNPLHLPFLNTVILVVSGLTVTYSHASLVLTKLWREQVDLHYFQINWPWYWDWINWDHFQEPTQSYVEDDVYFCNEALSFLAITILLGEEFTCFQLLEYNHALFYINDGIYGSTFYVATGFHGLHVLMGTIFLLVCFYSMDHDHFLATHHVGFEMAIWYWHFVDVVWLILYAFIYCWSGGFTALFI